MSAVMRSEIANQPAVALETLKAVDALAIKLESANLSSPSRVLFIARGTSDNVANYGSYLIPVISGIEAYSISPSLLNSYQVQLSLENTLVFAISQSGETAEIVQAASKAKEFGATVIAITNNLGSGLDKVSDFCLVTPAGIELAVPATKTYSAAVIALAALCAFLFDSKKLRSQLETVPALMSLQLEKFVLDEKIVELLASAATMVFAGRGLALGAILEAALKLKETCSINAVGTSVSDFVHGPISALGPKVPLVIFSADSDSPIYPGLEDLVTRAEKTGAPIVTFGLFKSAVPSALSISVLAQPGLELIAPLVIAIPSQLLAAAVADAKGLDADSPRVLSKLTQTV
jgi:glucosamine--fructose-6-phosphate aminotransferase (isomerizing)